MSLKKMIIICGILFLLFLIAWAIMPRPIDPQQAFAAEIDRIPLVAAMRIIGFTGLVLFLIEVVPDPDDTKKP